MEFFCYHRDRAGSTALREALNDEHLAYMDRFADGMIARGPTTTDGGETLTGSVHVVDLPGPEAARAFAFEEPNYQAGAYRDVLLRRWRNLVGRTMGEYAGGPEGGPRYLVLGLGWRGTGGPGIPAGQGGLAAGLVAMGPLLSDDGATVVGAAALVEAADAAEARRALVADDYAAVEVHDWSFGGRPAAS
ncbi:YciI family protein [Isoptericola sp. NPDC057653]|uniref:YciI family protein n=1 Tax=Isoptericola sp. NPDC057653 TaxID=3346195 RepID=UPI0036835AFE